MRTTTSQTTTVLTVTTTTTTTTTTDDDDDDTDQGRCNDNRTTKSANTKGSSNSYGVTVSKQDVDKLLASELNEMSLQEREEVYEQLHGVEDVLDETAEFLEIQMHAMETELLANYIQKYPLPQLERKLGEDEMGGPSLITSLNLSSLPAAATVPTSSLPARKTSVRMKHDDYHQIISHSFQEALLEQQLQQRQHQQQQQDNHDGLNGEDGHHCYLTSRKLWMQFLRAEDYNIQEAVRRLVHFVHEKWSWFGRHTLDRPLIFDDLSPDEQDYYQKGWYQILLQKDSSGRAVMLDTHLQYSPPVYEHSDVADTIVRSIIYLLCSAVDNDEETQRKGIVMVAYFVGKFVGQFNNGLLQKLNSLLDWCPVKYRGFHMCFNDPMLKAWMPLAMLLMGKEMRLRLRIHDGKEDFILFSSFDVFFWEERPVSISTLYLCYLFVHFFCSLSYCAPLLLLLLLFGFVLKNIGSHTECRYGLMTFGVPVGTLPIDHDGELDNRCHYLLLAKRLSYESKWSKRDSSSINNNLTNNSNSNSNQHHHHDTVNVSTTTTRTTTTTTKKTSTDGDIGKASSILDAAQPLPSTSSSNGMTGRVEEVSSTTSKVLFNGDMERINTDEHDGDDGGNIYKPAPQDVILRRGRVYQSHPGNLRMRQLLDLYREEYDTAPVGEKGIIAMKVVHTIQKESGGRFLEKDVNAVTTTTTTIPGGPSPITSKSKNVVAGSQELTTIWKEVSDKEAGRRVSKSFRSARRSQNSSFNTTTSASASSGRGQSVKATNEIQRGNIKRFKPNGIHTPPSMVRIDQMNSASRAGIGGDGGAAGGTVHGGNFFGGGGNGNGGSGGMMNSMNESDTTVCCTFPMFTTSSQQVVPQSMLFFRA